jgi:glycerophosphoryl diester phosphodiesterase
VRVLAAQATLCDRVQVADWHRRGFVVLGWTADDPALARALWAVGVDALAADDPAQLLAALGE